MPERKTKIVATLGPASSSPAVLRRMIEAGLDVARLNCSHATPEALSDYVEQIRRQSRLLDRPVGILLDLSGPKIRTGPLLGGGPVQLQEGAALRIGPDLAAGDASRVGCNYPHLARNAGPGDTVLLDDGLLELRVESVEGTDVVCRVVVGGLLHERKGINLPDAQVDIPALTEKDRRDLAVGVDLGVDYVALSFVQRAADLLELRAELDRLRSDVPIVAKIEKPQAILNLEEILEVTDGVMVARGDLGVEAGAHRVPVLQKRILAAANRRGLVDITATQMLDSMIRNPRPTRAEASDVANAILDGTDAVMLSGETATGRYPVEAVAMMDRIAREVEGSGWPEREEGQDPVQGHDGPSAAVARAACLIARDPRFRAIIVLTGTGVTARLVSAYRPRGDILALTPSRQTCQRLALVRGVRPVFHPFSGTTDAILASGEEVLLDRGLLAPGDEAILVSGQLDSRGVTHLLKVFTVGRHQAPSAGEASPTIEP